MKNRGLAALAMAGSLLFGLSIHAGQGGKEPENPPKPAEGEPTIRVVTDLPDLLKAHNQKRATKNLPPLKLNPRLTQAAARQARDMAEHGIMSHEGSDDSKLIDRIADAGYLGQSAAENIAKGFESVDAVVSGWMDSPTHRDNILGDFGEMGGARATSPDGTEYWCVDYGRPWPQLNRDQALADLIQALNQARSKAGKVPLKPQRQLQTCAARRAHDNATRAKIETADADGQTPLFRVTLTGYRYKQLVLLDSFGQANPRDALNGWLDEPEHSTDLLGPFTEVGAGVSTSPKGVPYWTLILAKPAR